jgi:cell division inhibitor SepF
MGFKELKQKFFPDNYDADYDKYDENGYIEGEDVEDEVVGDDGRAHVGAVRSVDTKQSYGNGAPVASRSTALEMKVVTPTKYEAVTQIADILLEKKTVLLNLENTNKETAKRLIDFLSGVAYALGGDIQKVADNTFAVTPNNVAVSNEAVDTEYSVAEEEGQY